MIVQDTQKINGKIDNQERSFGMKRKRRKERIKDQLKKRGFHSLLKFIRNTTRIASERLPRISDSRKALNLIYI